MARLIIKIRDKYFEWSTVTDSPSTYGMSEEEMVGYLLQEGIKELKQEVKERMSRVEKYGSSHMHRRSAEDIVRCNRAGEDETEMTIDEIYEHFQCGVVRIQIGKK